MKILMATDGSPSARAALDYLKDFPIPRDTELTILNVIDKEVYHEDELNELDKGQRESLEKTEKMLLEDAESMLEAEVLRNQDSDLIWNTSVKIGHPSEEIVLAAEAMDADLVVVGSHGMSEVKRFLLGSVSDQVLHYAHCSVLIVRPDRTGDTDDSQRAEHPLRILLAYDDSEDGKKAVEFSAALPLRSNTEITALTVLPLVTLFRQDIKLQLGWAWREKKKLSEKGLKWVTDTIKWPGTHVRPLLRESEDVCQEILDVADETDADLIIIGNKGMGAVKKFLLGSITRRVAHHAPCSVLAVRIKKP